MRSAWPLFLPMLLGLAAIPFLGDIDGETLRAHHGELRRLVDLHPVLAPVLAMVTYALVVAGFLPVALWVTLACGFAFGTFWGGVISVAGATAGATVTFLAARTGLGRPLRHRAGPWLPKVEKHFRKGAWSYLLVLRMVPAFPFWLTNILPALLQVSLPAFVVTTALGIAPATFVLASVGAGLAAVFARGESPDLSIMTDPEVLGPLLAVSALALAPLAWRRWKSSPVAE